MNDGMEYQAVGAQVAPLLEKVGKFITDMVELGIEHSVTVSVRKSQLHIAESAERAEGAEKSNGHYLGETRVLRAGPVLEIRPGEGAFVTSADGMRRPLGKVFGMPAPAGDGNEGVARSILAEDTPDPGNSLTTMEGSLQPGETVLGVIEEDDTSPRPSPKERESTTSPRPSPEGEREGQPAPKAKYKPRASEAKEVGKGTPPNPSTPAGKTEKQTSPAFKITLRNINAGDRETVSGLYRGDMSFRSLAKEQRQRLLLAAMNEMYQHQGAFTQAEFDGAKPGWMSAGGYIAQLLTIPWSGLAPRLAVGGTTEMWKD